MRFIKTIFAFVILLTLSLSTYAQDPLSGRDLTNFKTEALSENQISALQQKLKQSGMTIDQVQSQAIAKGMSPIEFAKLKDSCHIFLPGDSLIKSKDCRDNFCSLVFQSCHSATSWQTQWFLLRGADLW